MGRRREKYSNDILMKFKFHIVRHNSETARGNELQDAHIAKDIFKRIIPVQKIISRINV